MLKCGKDLQLNITVCISVLSIGLTCVYAGSRVLTALAETGFAPKCFQYVDKSGRPLYSVLVLLAAGPIGESTWQSRKNRRSASRNPVPLQHTSTAPLQVTQSSTGSW
mgnify:CR=1 FL=1